MKNHFKKIIIPIIVLGILLAPVSPIFQKNNEGNFVAGAGVEVNKAKAATCSTTATCFSKPQLLLLGNNSKSFKLQMNIVIANNVSPSDAYSSLAGGGTDLTRGVELLIAEQDSTGKPKGDTLHTFTLSQLIGNKTLDITKPTNTIIVTSDNTVLEPEKTYTAQLILQNSTWGGFTDSLSILNLMGGATTLATEGVSNAAKETIYSDPITIVTPATTSIQEDLGDVGATTTTSTATGLPVDDAIQWQCGIGNLGGTIIGCVAELLYMFYGLSAWVAELTGRFLDFFVYYSTNSSSYTNGFITQAFAAIRDVANIFFIIALLYVAIKTILDIGVTNSKKIIGTIVIVALLINFSLFFTQVIIDGSNILAKVFYNQISSVDKNGNPLPAGGGGEKSISIGLVNKFNPQEILAYEGGDTGNQGTFIFITFLSMFITFYTAFLFFMVAFLFVGRVVALWISMIFAPIAFASFTMPFNIPGIGHKDWWSDLIKNAFLAPIFIFFLYIIVMFAGFLNNIASYQGSGTTDRMQHIMTVVIPFAVLAVLLMKAKEIAVKLSGEIGKGITGMVKSVGGFVGGAALGATAFVGTATIGRAGSAISNSAWAKKMASSDKKFMGMRVNRMLGNKIMDTSKAVGKGTMDLRGVKIAGKTLASATGFNLGETKKGGFEQRKKEQIERRQTRAQELEAGYGEKEKKDLVKYEGERQNILSNLSIEIEKLDKSIEKTSQADTDAGNRVRLVKEQGFTPADQEYKDAVEEHKITSDNLQTLKAQQTALRKGEDFTGGIKEKDATGKTITKNIDKNYKKTARNIVKDKQGKIISDRSIEDYEDDLIPDATNTLKRSNMKRKFGYAAGMNTMGYKAVDYIFSGGMNSGIGSNEAMHKIIMETN